VRPHPAGGLRWKWDPFLVTTWGSFNFGQMEQMWSRIRVPTLAANGARSGEFWRRDIGRSKRGGEVEAYLAPDELQRRLACFPDVECVEIPGAGTVTSTGSAERGDRRIASQARSRKPARGRGG
jgi:hypothetical protein